MKGEFQEKKKKTAIIDHFFVLVDSLFPNPSTIQKIKNLQKQQNYHSQLMEVNMEAESSQVTFLSPHDLNLNLSDCKGQKQG